MISGSISMSQRCSLEVLSLRRVVSRRSIMWKKILTERESSSGRRIFMSCRSCFSTVGRRIVRDSAGQIR